MKEKCIAKDFYVTNYNYKANIYMATFNAVATLLSLVLEKCPTTTYDHYPLWSL